MAGGDTGAPAPGAEPVPADAAGKVLYYSKIVDERNDPDAMCALAGLLRSGSDNVAADVPRAVQLLQRGVEAGHAGCRVALLDFLSTVSAEPTMKDAAMGMLAPNDDEGDTVAPPGRPAEDAGAETLCNHATLMENGADGVPADPARAVELYEQAISRYSNEEAMNNLAILLESGAVGVPKDLPRAAGLYERAIEEGDHTEAMFNYAVLLARGAPGVKQNAPRAVELYTRAMVEGDDVDAMKNLAVLLQDGAEGVPQDLEKAEKIYEQALEKEKKSVMDVEA